MNGTGDQPAQPPKAVGPATERLHLADRLALRPKEAAEALGIGGRTLRKWMRDDGLPYRRIDGVVLIARRALERWLEEGTLEERRSDALAARILDDL